MSLNLECEGKPIARIIGKGKRKKIHKIIHVADEEENIMNSYKNIQCKEGEYLQHIPNFESERDVLYICGQSGSGKSYYAKNYIRHYNLVYPDRKVYILSTVSNDISLDGIKHVNYLDINSNEFLTIPLTAEDFSNSLVLFDDCDSVRDKLIKKKVDSLLTTLLNTGRHTHTTVIYLSHIACSGNETKSILNEAHTITFFPKGCGGRSLHYLLENYLNLDKKQIEQIKKLKSRWVTVAKSYPISILHTNGVYLLD
jgi:hypothetical protein